LEKTTSGDILINGRNVNCVSPRDRNIAMVFQDQAIYPHMTARQNIAFGLEMRGMPVDEVERRMHQAARALGISDLLSHKPGTLSGGQRQRVALARAMARVPGAQCVLLDEPLSNLDAHLRAALRDEIRSMHRQSCATIIHVTHDQEEAMALGQRIIVLAEGAVQQEGSPSEIYCQPRNRFVAGFVGSPAMNFMEGELMSEGGVLTFVEKGAAGAHVRLRGHPTSGLLVTPQAAVLGVRPEAVAIQTGRADQGAAHDGVLRGKVRFSEIAADRLYVHTMTGAGSVVIAKALSHEAINAGESVCLRIDLARVHLFAPGVFGRNLVH
jgi:multiple sugar transport system ATP-binding protein